MIPDLALFWWPWVAVACYLAAYIVASAVVEVLDLLGLCYSQRREEEREARARLEEEKRARLRRLVGRPAGIRRLRRLDHR